MPPVITTSILSTRLYQFSRVDYYVSNNMNCHNQSVSVMMPWIMLSKLLSLPLSQTSPPLSQPYISQQLTPPPPPPSSLPQPGQVRTISAHCLATCVQSLSHHRLHKVSTTALLQPLPPPPPLLTPHTIATTDNCHHYQLTCRTFVMFRLSYMVFV